MFLKDTDMQSGFDSFGLPPKLVQALTRNKFTEPTPIQAQTIPLAWTEKRDVLGSAQTGTGKTGAFGIPVIAGLMENPEAAALIMTPTRELAGQVMKALEPMIPTVDIRTALLIGGEAMPRQFGQLRHNPRLIVGTPGRINDHLERGTLKLENVRYLVLDETDRMLDMGFGIQIERIVQHIKGERQTLLFSATMPSNIGKLSSKYMNNPARVAVGSTTTPAAKIKQEVISTTDAEKYSKLLEQIDRRKGSIIIFVKTKHGTEKLADKLNRDAHKADAIHGDLQQRRRERVIQNFRDKKYRILVATDVAARGLDIPHIEHVVNYDMPQAPEDYIHRIGRTARAGAEGEAVSFLTSADGMKWRAIQRLMNGEDPGAPQQRGGGGRNGPPRGRFGGGGGGGGGGFGGGRRFASGRSEGGRSEGGRSEGGRAEGGRSEGQRSEGSRSAGDRPRSDRPRDDRPNSDRPRGDRPFGDRPRGDAPRSEASRSDRPHADRPHSDKPHGDKLHGDKPHRDKSRGDKPHYADRPRSERSSEARASTGARSFTDKPRGERSFGDKSRSDKPRSDRPQSDRPRSDRPHSERPRSDRPAGGRSFGAKKTTR